MKKIIKKFLKIFFKPKIIRKNFEKLIFFYRNNFLNEIEKIYVYKKLDTEQIAGPIDSDFPREDGEALSKIVKMYAKENMMIAEIGSWKGMSTIVLAKSISPFKGKIFAIDHWLGSEKVPHHEIAKKIDMFSVFKKNMISFGVWEIIYPMIMDSATAASIFKDESLDLIFLDADHRYSMVKTDILNWLPKLKKGGIFCGHDSENYYTKFPPEIKKRIDAHLEEDIISEYQIHPGVIKALYDCFNDNYFIIPNSKVWYYIKK